MEKDSNNQVIETEEKSADLIKYEEEEELQAQARMVAMQSLLFYGTNKPTTVDEILEKYGDNVVSAQVEIDMFDKINKGRIAASKAIRHQGNQFNFQFNMQDKDAPLIKNGPNTYIEGEVNPDEEMWPCPKCGEKVKASGISNHSKICGKV